MGSGACFFNDMNQKIAAIIIAYLPDGKTFAGTIGSLYGQVDTIYVVDNTPGGSDIFRDSTLLGGKNNIELVALNENLGIAEAQNIGIKKALASGIKFVLLSDQDTHYPLDYVAKMLEVYEAMPEKEKIAVIVPDFAELNRGGERQGFVLFNGFFSRRIYPKNGYYKITQAIASGMIIPSGVFGPVGFMDEKLFIDWVDIEWCWRARAKGFTVIGCADVVIQHSLGDAVKKFGSKSYSIRSPIRHYYIIRNGIDLALRSPDINFGMRFTLFRKSFRYIVGFTLLGKPHGNHFAYCLKGFYHGVIGRLGAY
jgi:rhamnosyltransferase